MLPIASMLETRGTPTATTTPIGLIVSRRRSLWHLLRRMLVRGRILSQFVPCGGTKARRRRRRVERGKGRELMPRSRPLPPLPPLPPPPPTVESISTSVHQLRLSPEEEGCVRGNNNELTEEGRVPILHHQNLPPSPTHTSQDRLHIYPDPPLLPPPTPTALPPNDRKGAGGQSSAPPTTSAQKAEVKLRERGVGGSLEFHGWRKSSVDVVLERPLTLSEIPQSGLKVGDKVVWIPEDPPTPESATVTWTGKLRGEFYAGIEFERRIGNSSGLYGYGGGLFERLFSCQLGYGRFVPIRQLVLHSDFHDRKDPGDGGVKAGFICVICRDDFLELPEKPELVENDQMVATTCGHLYHQVCLRQWLSSATKHSGNKCPHCQSEVRLDSLIRLFPAQI